MTDVRAIGERLFTEIMGEERGAEMRRSIVEGGFAGAMAGLATDFSFGTVWAREGLDRKQRSLVTIGVLIAQRQMAELKNHFRIALTNGVLRTELEEALIQAVPYTGFPAVASASGALIEVLRERGLDTETRTSSERGLL